MAITRTQKSAQIALLTDKFKSAQSVIFAHYIGMTVAEASELRSKLKKQDAEMRVAKKTLIKIAAKGSAMPELNDSVLDGPVSLIFSFSDPLSGAQVAFKFGKDHKQIEILGGLFSGRTLTKEEAIELAKMPGRKELLLTFICMLRSPLTTFACMCGSPLSGFARALNELAEKKATEETEATEETKETKDSSDASSLESSDSSVSTVASDSQTPQPT